MTQYAVAGVAVVKDDNTIDWSSIKSAPQWVIQGDASNYTGTPTVVSNNVQLADVSATLQFGSAFGNLQAKVLWGTTDIGYPNNCADCG